MSRIPDNPTTLTVRVEIKDREAAKVFWESAKGEGVLVAGCQVTGLSWEDLFELQSEWESQEDNKS